MRRNNQKQIWASLSQAVFSLFILTIILTSCAKERLESKKDATGYSKPTAFYNKNQQQEQEFIIDSLGTGPIIGKMGTKFYPYKDIFMYPNGQDITFPFTLKVMEIYPVKDIILSNLPTIATGNILESKGEIRARAFKGSQELVLKPGRKFYMELDSMTNLLTSMSVYYGFDSYGINDWTSNLSSLDATINPDTLSSVANQPDFYSMNIGRMGWVDCARLYNNSGSTTALTFTAPGSDPQNIDIFLVFNDIPSVMKVYNLQSYEIPVGTQLTVIAIAMDQNNSLVYDQQSITVSNNQQISLNPVSVTESALLNILSGL